MSLARRIAGHFVAPSERLPEDFVTPGEAPDPTCAERHPHTSPGVAVLCAAPDAAALGSALGLALARARRAPAAAVCVWTPAGTGRIAWTAPALPAARRLAASLGARGLDARPAGRLVLVRLGADAAQAAAEARRALAAAGAVPTVLALGGPRAAVFDALLDDQDLVVVATAGGADAALARLAVAGLVRACVCEAPAAQAARALACAGVALAPSLRRALAGPVAELP
jgi:hypothetical protein